MLKNRIVYISSLFVISLIIGIVMGAENTSTEKNNSESTAKKGALLFFMNPNGRPCQMQNEIIVKTKSITDKTNIVYISTSVPEDRKKFYTYGVRALPSLILVDDAGTVVKRFTPGIKSAAEISEEVKKF